jgi:hypothetical protein
MGKEKRGKKKRGKGKERKGEGREGKGREGKRWENWPGAFSQGRHTLVAMPGTSLAVRCN